MPDRKRKGMLLFIVLATIILVSILCTVILRIMLSQSRLTHHQVSRIQAQYAAKAGMVYALDRLRMGLWSAGTDCAAGSPCSMIFQAGAFLPPVLVSPTNGVSIVIRQPQSTNILNPCYNPAGNPPGDNACVSVTATYTAATP